MQITIGLLSGYSSFIEVEVGVDVLCVVEVFEGFEEADHGVGLRAFEFGVGGGDLGDFGVLGGDLGRFQGFGYGFEVFGVGEDFPVVAFVGEVFGDRPDYYGSADLYLCPTRIASFGVTLLEAMACGTPMVVADNVGFRYVVDGGAEAVILPKDDPAAWAETAIALLADPERRRAMSEAGLAKAARFAWPRIARQELAVYERVLGRSAGVRRDSPWPLTVSRAAW